MIMQACLFQKHYLLKAVSEVRRPTSPVAGQLTGFS